MVDPATSSIDVDDTDGADRRENSTRGRFRWLPNGLGTLTLFVS